MILLLKVCFTLTLLCGAFPGGASLGFGEDIKDSEDAVDCTVVKRGTWNFNYGVDEEIPGVRTVEDCKQLCLDDSQNCRGYTHSMNEVIGYCYKFKELTGYMRECPSCVSGTTPAYVTGDVTCIISPHCFEYNIMDEETRNVNSWVERNAEVTLMDNMSKSKSARWMGHGYYRMLPPAGTVIPEFLPNTYGCHAESQGYLKPGSHPEVVGQEVKSKVQIGRGRYGSELDITITKCPGGYFVYYLPEATRHSRYCATDEL